MLKHIVMIIAGLCFSTSIAYAQGDAKSNNPYLTEMQQTLDKANSKAVSDFNKQYPQPTPTVNESKQTNTSSAPKPPTQTSTQHPPTTVNNPPPDIAVTEQKKNEKKDEVVNIFATPGTTTSENNGTNTQNQGTPNIFR